MKRLNTELLISAAVFSAAMNMNGCVYGPPEDQMVHMSYIQKAEEQTEESEIPETGKQTESLQIPETEKQTEKLQIPETDIEISNVRNGK